MLSNIKKKISIFVHEIWALVYPSNYAKYVYHKATGKILNLQKPDDFDEKNFWLRVNADLSQWTELADKIKVRDYVKQCGYEKNLVELYGIYDDAECIDFNKLPANFVIKTNHGFGKIIIVSDKSNLDIEATRRKLDGWVKERYSYVSFEPHYWNIEPKLIIEEQLYDRNTKHISHSLIDYKFFCINGNPEIIKVMYNRVNKYDEKQFKKDLGYKTIAFDLDWKSRPDIIPETKRKSKDVNIPKPKNLNKMIEMAKNLSKSFPQVRVDLYEVNGNIYFGELTFTPGGGKKFTSEYSLELGGKMDLSMAMLRNKSFIRSYKIKPVFKKLIA